MSFGKRKITKINIVGAGPTGSLLAYSLGSAGLAIELFDKSKIDDLKVKNQSYAITHSSKLFFEKLGIWKDLKKDCIPFKRLILKDMVSNSQSIFTTDHLISNSKKNEAIGWTISHENLMNILITNINSHENINIYDSTRVESFIQRDDELLIAANGYSSSARNNWRIRSYTFNYSQACLTVKVKVNGTDCSTAYEILRKEGPLAILPLGNNTFQIIWSAPKTSCNRRVNNSDYEFISLINSILPKEIVVTSLVDRRAIFPLKFLIAYPFYSLKGILIGESAHKVHPVAGQGLNLCCRDVELLSSILRPHKKKSLFSKDPISMYNIPRMFDIIIMSLFTDLIVRLFSNDISFLLGFRKFFFLLLNRFKVLKKLILALMTYGPLKFLNNVPK